jgi:hypothetical protein
MKKKDIIFTFDYELFLGEKSGSVQNCMIRPTNALLSILNIYQCKGVFFVDCSCLLKLSENLSNPTIKHDYETIVGQIQNLIKSGHYVFPHVHPHWIDASYNENRNEWDLSNTDKYRLHRLPAEQQVSYFKSCFDILKGIIDGAFSFYKMDSYRAGGWCIQPFDVFERIFQTFQIKNDFSVLGGYHKEGNTLSFNFIEISENAKPYKFQNSVVQENKTGEFIEFPISSIHYEFNNFVNRIVKKVLWRSAFGKPFGDGYAAHSQLKIDEKSRIGLEMVSIELLTTYNLKWYKKFLKDNDYMQFISHPKMISKHNLNMLNRFLKFAQRQAQLNTDFREIKL